MGTAAQNKSDFFSSFEAQDASAWNAGDSEGLDQQMHCGLNDVGDESAFGDRAEQSTQFDDVDYSLESYELSFEASTTSHLDDPNNLGYLARLRRPQPLVKQSVDLVSEALCAISEQMLRNSTFPSFIHPHWHCEAMPEPLAICMRIAQMFATRTPEVEPFIWRTKLADQRRVIDQVSTPC